MKILAYLVYGNKNEYQLELTYSVLTAARFFETKPSDVKVVLLTDEANRRNDLPVEHFLFSPSDFAKWTRDGTYNHEAKIHALAAILGRYNAPTALIDTDTYFSAHPDTMFERIGPRRAVMQAVDGDSPIGKVAYWRPIIDAAASPFNGYAIDANSLMYNSGVVGLNPSEAHLLNDILEMSSYLYTISNVFNVEQFSFTNVLLKNTEISLCPDIVEHYWGHSRRFAHAQIAAAFPAFTAANFRKNLEKLPYVGYPQRSRLNQVLARLKELQRRHGGDYRFAYLAYRSACVTPDPAIANAWGQVAVDVLASGDYPRSHVIQDFRKMMPERFHEHAWMTPETKESWTRYFESLGPL